TRSPTVISTGLTRAASSIVAISACVNPVMAATASAATVRRENLATFLGPLAEVMDQRAHGLVVVAPDQNIDGVGAGAAEQGFEASYLFPLSCREGLPE